MMQCKQCGQLFDERQGPGRKRLFCSDPCQREWWREHPEERKHYTYTCQECGKKYQAKGKDRDRFCSRECAFAHKAKDRPENVAAKAARREAERQAKIVYARCSECGAEFIQRYGRQTCSDSCQRALNRRSYAEYAKRRKGENRSICIECGKEFSAPYGDKRRGFCSDECGRRHNGRIHEKVRRARAKSNGPIERIDPIVVFNRDSWICGICGKKVNKRLKFPNPKSASLDHVVPLARGGSHTYQNVQLAHLSCNVLKRDQGDKQMRLDV